MAYYISCRISLASETDCSDGQFVYSVCVLRVCTPCIPGLGDPAYQLFICCAAQSNTPESISASFSPAGITRHAGRDTPRWSHTPPAGGALRGPHHGYWRPGVAPGLTEAGETTKTNQTKPSPDDGSLLTPPTLRSINYEDTWEETGRGINSQRAAFLLWTFGFHFHFAQVGRFTAASVAASRGLQMETASSNSPCKYHSKRSHTDTHFYYLGAGIKKNKYK